MIKLITIMMLITMVIVIQGIDNNVNNNDYSNSGY